MQRKWTVLAVAMASCLALAAGFAWADDDSELHKLMEQVNAKNAAITKAVRTKVNFAKGQKDVVKNADELAKLAEKAKPIKDAVKKAKANKEATDENWDKLMDVFIKTSKDLAATAAKDGATFEAAKQSHSAVKKSCSECHMVFRVEDE